MKVPCNVLFSKLVGLGCDGASNMTGQWNCLIALLKEQPSVVVVHCFAHGLELALKDASDSNSLHEKVIAYCWWAYNTVIIRITVNWAMLKMCSSSLKRKVHIPTRVGGTRWVGHLHKALKIVVSSNPVIIPHLQQVSVWHFIFIFKHYSLHTLFNVPVHKYSCTL